MKRLICLLLLLSVFRLDAALTVTSRGGMFSNTSNTTLAGSPSGTMSVGNLGVLVCSYTNAGAGGNNDVFTQATFNDSVGNTWTRQLDTMYDPGAALAGAEVAVYTAPILTQITVTDTVTLTTSTSQAGKTARFIEVSGLNGVPTVVTSGSISDQLTSGQTGTAVSMTTGSIANNDAVICWAAFRNATLPTGDSDTTNGSWSAIVGTSASAPMMCATQNKVVTATGTQTWDITLAASVAWQSAWIEIAEAVAGSQSTTNGFF